MSAVRFAAEGPVGIVTLDRPDRRNAIDAAAGRALAQAIDRLEGDPALRVGILRAEGPVFSAGMDLRAFAEGEAEAILFGPGGFGGLVSREREKPLIAAVQGPAIAGGFELMLACDLALAVPGARFSLPESRLGLVAGGGGAFRLGQRLPPVVAAEMLLTGEPIAADRALELGLVNRLVAAEDLDAAAMGLARRIAANAPLALAASLRLMRAAVGPDPWPLNDRELRRMIASEDATEGARAFVERRDPVWTGR